MDIAYDCLLMMIFLIYKITDYTLTVSKIFDCIHNLLVVN